MVIKAFRLLEGLDFLRKHWSPGGKISFFQILEFSNEKQGFKSMFFYRANLPVKNPGFKIMFFVGIFEEALKSLIRPLGAL